MIQMWISRSYLYSGFLFALPFFVANVLVATKAQFFLTLIRPSGQTTGYEQILILVLIALVGVGGLVMLVPIVKDRRVYIVNALVGVLFVYFSVFIGYKLGLDVYHCNILQIPNCD